MNLPKFLAINLLVSFFFFSSSAANAAPSVSSEITVGVNPYELAVNTQTNRVYVGHDPDPVTGFNFTVIDGNTDAVITTLAVGTGRVVGLAVNETDNLIFATANGNVYVIDGNTNLVIASIVIGQSPHKIAYNSNNNSAYVVRAGIGDVAVIDGLSLTVSGHIPVGNWPWGVAVNNATNKLYVTNYNDSTLSVINAATNTVEATLALSGAATWVTVDENANKIFASVWSPRGLDVIDGSNNSLISSISRTYEPQASGVDPVTGRIHLINYLNSSLSVLDGTTLTEIASLPVGTFAVDVAINPVTRKVYVSNFEQGTISVILDLPDSTVSFDAGNYQGLWLLQNHDPNKFRTTNWIRGSHVLATDPGYYSMYFGSYGIEQIHIDEYGNVTQISEGNFLTQHASGQVSFNTRTVSIDPGNYPVVSYLPGTFLNESDNNWKPINTITLANLVQGTRYQVRTGTGYFLFDLAENGLVTIDSGAASGGIDSMVYNTVDVNVNAGLYAGLWRVEGVESTWLSGSRVVTMVPGTTRNAFRPGLGFVFFNIDGAGNISLPLSPGAAVGGNASLNFNTVPVYIDVGNYSGTWWFGEGTVRGQLPGSDTLNLVPNSSQYVIDVATYGQFIIDIDENANVTVRNQVSAAGGIGTLTFNTVDIGVDVSQFDGYWGLIGVVDFGPNASQSLALVPGVSNGAGNPGYYLQNRPGGSTLVQQVGLYVSGPDCAVNPGQIDNQGQVISLTCGGLPDGDIDGVPDLYDNCPLDANSDQLDQDTDGIGNVCDPDLDGDEVLNINDNCPVVANSDQSDVDGDSIGDLCDSDSDGDTVSNDIDNCPGISNPGQENNDGDQVGDACDLDDDNDLVLDEMDNCPLTANPDQTDSDLDGVGDVCDSDQIADADNDGVVNGNDLCPSSPSGVPVNLQGCTGIQLVDLNCQVENFIQHGKYVSCVSHVSKDAVNQGLNSARERSAIVSSAARSNKP